MNKYFQSVCIALALTSVACNSGSPPSGSGGVTAPPPPSPPSSSPPPLIPEIGCDTMSFAKTSGIDALPGGIWFGSLVDCQRNTSYDFATALVSEDGRFRVIGENGHLLSGVLQTDGDTFNGGGLDFAAAGYEYFSGPTTGLSVLGSVQERYVLQGRWWTEWGSYGYFSFDYREWPYEISVSINRLAGVWTIYHGQSAEGTWTIEPDGSFNGQDQKGCLHSGQFSLIDDRFSIVAVELTIAGCSLAGTYSGLAYYESIPDWGMFTIDISVDNGEQALRMLLML